MEVRMIGDEIFVDGVAVGVLAERRSVEREVLRDALNCAPEIEHYLGGPGSFANAAGGLQEDLDDAEERVQILIAAIGRAISQIRGHDVKDAIRTLEIALD